MLTVGLVQVGRAAPMTFLCLLSGLESQAESPRMSHSSIIETGGLIPRLDRASTPVRFLAPAYSTMIAPRIPRDWCGRHE